MKLTVTTNKSVFTAFCPIIRINQCRVSPLKLLKSYKKKLCFVFNSFPVKNIIIYLPFQMFKILLFYSKN